MTVRIVGIRHRNKRNREEEARPTEVAVFGGKKPKTYKLESEDDEYDWLRANFPVKFRKIEPEEDISSFRRAHVKWRKVKDGADLPGLHESQVLYEEKVTIVTQVQEGEKGGKRIFRKVDLSEDVTDYLPDRIKTRQAKPGEYVGARHSSQILRVKLVIATHVAKQVPTTYDGLQAGDHVVMILGGSGDPFAYALSRRAESIMQEGGAETAMYRTPPMALKTFRDSKGEKKKDQDHQLLGELYQQTPAVFYRMGPADRERIELAVLYRQRRETQEQRKKAVQRLEQRLIGEIFVRPDGDYPEKSIRDQVSAAVNNSAQIQALLAEENERTSAIEKRVKRLPIYAAIFEDVKGFGAMAAAGVLIAIGDVRRFEVLPDQSKIDTLRIRVKKLKKEAGYERDKEAAYTWLRNSVDTLRKKGQYKGFLDSGRFPRNLPEHFRYRAVASYLSFTHKEEEAAKLREAADLYLQIAKMIRKAKNQSEARFAAFCGVHCMSGGKYADVPPEKSFPRRRSGQISNWNPLARQRLYLLADQFNRHKDRTEWGRKFLEVKAGLRAKHEHIVVDGKNRYTNGHIHKMARWKMLRKFVRKLFHTWLAFEKKKQKSGGDTPTKAVA